MNKKIAVFDVWAQLLKFTIFAAMTLRNFYIFMLCCSGLILMAHIFVPHHHHTSQAKQQSVVKHESSHNDDHHGHHHHKNADNEEPSSDTPLSHSLHQESIAKFVMKQTISSIEIVKVFCIPQYFNPAIVSPAKISTIHYKLDKGNLKSSYYASCIVLRGPPSMLFS